MGVIGISVILGSEVGCWAEGNVGGKEIRKEKEFIIQV